MIALALGVTCPAAAQSGSISIAWDANPEAYVAGYMVYVGVEPGAYAEVYDVGKTTSFTYQKTLEGDRYFFSVAAYAEGLVLGPRSDEVSTASAGALSLSSTSRSAPAASRVDAAASASPGAMTAASRSCASVGTFCSRVETLVTTPASVGALSAAPDGRLFFIENGDRVRAVDRTGLIPQPALTLERGASQVIGLALDPNFLSSHFVFVAETVGRADGSRDLTIVRFREVNNVLGEGAALVTGVRLPPTGDAPFTVDRSGRFFIAVPMSAGSADIYSGMVLQFEADGSVPAVSVAG